MSCCGGGSSDRHAEASTVPKVNTGGDKKAAPNGELMIKLLLLGDSGVGKTCLLLRYSDDMFADTFISTIGIDFKHKTIELEGRKVKLQIWDTAGQEKYRTITTAYYRSAQGILLCYDSTDEKSFQNIANWARNIEEHASTSVNRILIATKCDQESKRAVPAEKGKALADKYGIPFLETSAKTNANVAEAFQALASAVKDRIDRPLP